MLIAPWPSSDRDGETAHGAKFAMSAPNVMIADRRLNIAVYRATFECSMMASLFRAVADQRDLVSMVRRFQFDRDRSVDVVNTSIYIESLRWNAV
jgi:hypothetical protein